MKFLAIKVLSIHRVSIYAHPQMQVKLKMNTLENTKGPMINTYYFARPL